MALRGLCFRLRGHERHQTSKMHHETTRAVAIFLKRGKGIPQAAKHLRTKADALDQANALRQLPVADTNVQDLLTGNLFATNWKDVWKRSLLVSIPNSQKALHWWTVMIEYHAEKLAAHAQLRTTLTHAVLLGKWQEAQQILRRHQETFGPTLWLLAWLMLIAEETGGTAAKQELLERFKGPDYGTIVPIFASFYSISTDKTLPEENFRTALRNGFPSRDRAVFQFLELLFFEDSSANWQSWEMLQFAELLPLVDRYEFLLRLSSIAFGEGHVDSPKLARAVVRLARSCNDVALSYMADCVDTTDEALPCGETVPLLRAWDCFMASHYDESLRLAAELANRRPELVPAHELLVKSAMYLGKTELLTGVTPVTLLWHHLRNVFAKNEHSEDSLGFLHRFGSRFRILSVTAPLRALHAQHSSPYPDNRLHRRASYSFAAHGPRNFEYGHPLDVNLRYLSRCTTAFPKSIATFFFFALSNGQSGMSIEGCDLIPPIRRYFFGGIAATRRNALSEAHSYLTEFLALQANDKPNPLSPFAIEEARRALIDVYRLNGDVIEMQRIVVHAFLDRAQSVRRLPLRTVFEACNDNKTETGAYIDYPLVTYLASDNPHEVSLALRRYMRSLSVEKPSDLPAHAAAAIRTLAMLFLRVCTPEVLDSLPILDSVEKVEEERLALLRWIEKNAPAYARVAETEILRLTQNAQLREALEKIEGARVVLNLSALREAEQERFGDAYFRYAAQREMATAKTKDELLNAINILRQSGRGYVVIPLEHQETAFSAFVSAFREIRDAFVSSPHFGIEACLSGRIRHGIVIQHIRKPFVERKLAISEASQDRAAIEHYWSDRLSFHAEPKKTAAVMSILLSMTNAINATAEEVKGIWIQSKTENRNPEGLFDYSFTDEQLDRILADRIRGAATVDSFLDGVFDVLLQRTRDSLKIVRHRIDSDLRRRLGSTVDDAISTLAALPFAPSLLLLRNDLAASRQDTEQTCRQMARWFQGADATLMSNVDFDLVARTAVGMVEMLNPDVRGCHQVEVKSSFNVRGRHFTALVHMLFFLLDNAIRYSDAKKEEFLTKVRINAESNQLILCVENRMSCARSATEAATRITNKIADLKVALDLDKVVREGGTGFAKIIVAVRYEFKKPHPLMEAVSDNENVAVFVKCELAGLAA